MQYRADTSFSDSCITFTYESFSPMYVFKVIRIPESNNVCLWNPQSRFWYPEFFTQGIRNPAKDWNPEFTVRNPESNKTV